MSSPPAVRNWNDALRFFGSHDTEMSAVSHCPINGLLGKLVEPHDDLAMNIYVVRLSQDLDESRLVDFAGNDFSGDDQAGEELRKVSRCFGMQSLFIQDVLLNGGD